MYALIHIPPEDLSNMFHCRSAPFPSARMTRSLSSAEPTRVARARSHPYTVSSTSCTLSASPAKSPTASPFPSELRLPRSRSPSSSLTRTVRTSSSASLQAVSPTRRSAPRLKLSTILCHSGLCDKRRRCQGVRMHALHGRVGNGRRFDG